MEISTPYISCCRGITEDGYKLVCIPHAGGSASAFCRWQKSAGEDLEIMPVQLPGREERICEDLLTDFPKAVREVADAVEQYLKDGRFSLFGHSLGGTLAFELSKELERRGLHAQTLFIASTDIDAARVIVKSENLDDDAFFARVRSYGAIDENSEILQYPEFMEIFFKMLRADFTLSENYEYDGIRTSVPIAALCGTEDPMETIEKMHSWENCTESGACFREFEGGHFFIEDNMDEVIGYIREHIFF
jgi:medium-chain acyl-[acyl-carrier-protein] hydrolase